MVKKLLASMLATLILSGCNPSQKWIQYSGKVDNFPNKISLKYNHYNQKNQLQYELQICSLDKGCVVVEDYQVPGIDRIIYSPDLSHDDPLRNLKQSDFEKIIEAAYNKNK